MTADRPAPPEGALEKILRNRPALYDPDLIAEARAELEELLQLAEDECKPRYRCTGCLNGDSEKMRTIEHRVPMEPVEYDVECLECGSLHVFEEEDALGQVQDERDALRATVARLERTQAVCHCGEYVKDHGPGAGHSPVDMVEGPCPDNERLNAAVSRLERERDEAREFGEEAAARYNALLEGQRVLRCAFCDVEYPPGTPPTQHDALADHIQECPAHPMRAAKSRAAELREEVERLRGALADNEALLEQFDMTNRASGAGEGPKPKTLMDALCNNVAKAAKKARRRNR